jgi:hypothetical protein
MMLAKTPNRKRAIEYLAACGAAAITIIVRDGLGTITTGKTTTGTVAAQWWIAERTARAWARRLAGSWRHSRRTIGHRGAAALCGLATGDADAA